MVLPRVWLPSSPYADTAQLSALTWPFMSMQSNRRVLLCSAWRKGGSWARHGAGISTAGCKPLLQNKSHAAGQGSKSLSRGLTDSRPAYLSLFFWGAIWVVLRAYSWLYIQGLLLADSGDRLEWCGLNPGQAATRQVLYHCTISVAFKVEFSRYSNYLPCF